MDDGAPAPVAARTEETDVLVIGGGPAGLSAAIYLARFHLRVIVVDRGGGRASLIPKTRNHAGFPDGIAGRELIDRMRRQATQYGAVMIDDAVTTLARSNPGFVATAGTGEIRARAVLLATGVANRRPAMDDAVHDEAVRRGLLRYCPICDGFEVTDKRIAVIGTGERGVNEAIFLRSYTANVTLIAPDGPHALDHKQQRALSDAGIAARGGPCHAIEIAADVIIIATSSRNEVFDAAYPALGSDIHSELAMQVGTAMSSEGCLIVDSHQRTDVAGLYAAGDVSIGLDQISHAMGEGGVAATTIRNELAERAPLRR